MSSENSTSQVILEQPSSSGAPVQPSAPPFVREQNDSCCWGFLRFVDISTYNNLEQVVRAFEMREARISAQQLLSGNSSGNIVQTLTNAAAKSAESSVSQLLHLAADEATNFAGEIIAEMQNLNDDQKAWLTASVNVLISRKENWTKNQISNLVQILDVKMFLLQSVNGANVSTNNVSEASVSDVDISENSPKKEEEDAVVNEEHDLADSPVTTVGDIVATGELLSSEFSG